VGFFFLAGGLKGAVGLSAADDWSLRAFSTIEGWSLGTGRRFWGSPPFLTKTGVHPDRGPLVRPFLGAFLLPKMNLTFEGDFPLVLFFFPGSKFPPPSRWDDIGAFQAAVFFLQWNLGNSRSLALGKDASCLPFFPSLPMPPLRGGGAQQGVPKWRPPLHFGG